MDDFSSIYMDFSSSNSYGMGLQDNFNHPTVDFDASSFQDASIVDEKCTIKSSNIVPETSTFDFLNDTPKAPSYSLSDVINGTGTSQHNSSNSTLENLLEGTETHVPTTKVTNTFSQQLETSTNNEIGVSISETTVTSGQELPKPQSSTSMKMLNHITLGSLQSSAKNLCKVQIVKKLNGITVLNTTQPIRIIHQPSITTTAQKNVIDTKPIIVKPILQPPIQVNNVPPPEPTTKETTMDDLTIKVSNVVASFKVCCHLNLRKIALEGVNVVYQRETKKIVMRIRNPSCTAYIWSSGRIVCTGAGSEILSRKAARKFARRLQKIGFKAVFAGYKVINVLSVCRMPYAIDITEFSKYHRGKYVSYEPELHPAVTYRIPEWKVSLKIFSTGSITLTSPNVETVRPAIARILPLVKEFFRYDQKAKPSEKLSDLHESDEDVM